MLVELQSTDVGTSDDGGWNWHWTQYGHNTMLISRCGTQWPVQQLMTSNIISLNLQSSLFLRLNQSWLSKTDVHIGPPSIKTGERQFEAQCWKKTKSQTSTRFAALYCCSATRMGREQAGRLGALLRDILRDAELCTLCPSHVRGIGPLITSTDWTRWDGTHTYAHNAHRHAELLIIAL